MPIYEYRCPRRGHVFDKLVRLGAADAPPCPRCGAADAQRLVSLVARPAGDCGPGGT